MYVYVEPKSNSHTRPKQAIMQTMSVSSNSPAGEAPRDENKLFIPHTNQINSYGRGALLRNTSSARAHIKIITRTISHIISQHQYKVCILFHLCGGQKSNLVGWVTAALMWFGGDEFHASSALNEFGRDSFFALRVVYYMRGTKLISHYCSHRVYICEPLARIISWRCYLRVCVWCAVNDFLRFPPVKYARRSFISSAQQPAIFIIISSSTTP